MSRVTTLSWPATLPAQIPPMRPATGPDMRRLTGRCVADSTVAMPPDDCMSWTPRREACALHRLVEAGHVPRDLRADVRVQADRREPLVLAVERQHLVRDREVGVGELLEHDLLDPPLVLGVQVRVKQADGDRVDAGLPELPDALAHLVLVERREHLAVGGRDALLDREAMPALGERPRLPRELLLEREVEGLLVAGDVEDVAEALGRQHPDLGAAVREDDVRRDGRPVQEVVDLGQRDAGLGAELLDALDDGARRGRPGWRRPCRPRSVRSPRRRG